MSEHTCHAHGCKAAVPPRMFVCGLHWRCLPRKLQRAIWREYVPGQERRKDPTVRYLAVQRRAVGWLAFEPNNERAARAAAPYMIEGEIYRAAAIKAGLGDPLAGLPGGPAELPPDFDPELAARTAATIRAEARRLGEL